MEENGRHVTGRFGTHLEQKDQGGRRLGLNWHVERRGSPGKPEAQQRSPKNNETGGGSERKKYRSKTPLKVPGQRGISEEATRRGGGVQPNAQMQVEKTKEG